MNLPSVAIEAVNFKRSLVVTSIFYQTLYLKDHDNPKIASNLSVNKRLCV